MVAGGAVLDHDNDGLVNIAFVALDNETFPLFRNTGDNTFEEATSTTGLTMLTRKMATGQPDRAGQGAAKLKST